HAWTKRTRAIHDSTGPFSSTPTTEAFYRMLHGRSIRRIKPVVENTVRFVRERFFKGETFIDLSDVARRALIWCRDTAGRRIHGTTRQVPVEMFESQEKPVLIPLQGGRFDPPHWTDCKIHPDRHV